MSALEKTPAPDYAGRMAHVGGAALRVLKGKVLVRYEGVTDGFHVESLEAVESWAKKLLKAASGEGDEGSQRPLDPNFDPKFLSQLISDFSAAVEKIESQSYKSSGEEILLEMGATICEGK